MNPARGRHLENLVFCEAPQDKAPEKPPPQAPPTPTPPTPSAPPLSNPSLLKALEAVVAAGRQGLLGPVAAAAAANIPPLDAAAAAEGAAPQVKSPQKREAAREQPGLVPVAIRTSTQGAAGSAMPLPASSLPPAAAAKKKKKKKKKKPLQPRLLPLPLPLPPPPPPKAPPPQQQQEIHPERPALITILPTATRAGSLVQNIWICGNSIILTSKQRAESQPHGLQLGIPHLRAVLYWQGIESLRWEELLLYLRDIYNPRQSPALIIIHVGEDDLLPGNNISLLMAMKNDLGILRRIFPHAIIVWSALLPTHILQKDRKPEEIEQLRKHINSKMVGHCNELGIQFLSHILITSDKTGLFLPHLKTLSDEGADTFIADLQRILSTYGFMAK